MSPVSQMKCTSHASKINLVPGPNRKAYQSIFDAQDALVEHKDYGTPSHSINEALGDMLRELTGPWPAWSYISEKIRHVESYIDEEMDVHGEIAKLNGLERTFETWASEPKTRAIWGEYLRRNAEFRDAILHAEGIDRTVQRTLYTIATMQRMIVEFDKRLDPENEVHVVRSKLRETIAEINEAYAARKAEGPDLASVPTGKKD